MQWGALTLAILGAYLLQSSVLFVFGVAWFDPFLMLTLMFGLLMSGPEARLSGWCAGLAQDLGSLDPLGVHAVTLGLTALLATQLRRALNANVWWARVLILLIAAWPPQVLYLMHLHYSQGHGGVEFWEFVRRAGWLSVMTTGITLFLLALPWVAAWRQRRQRGSARRAY